MTCVTCVHQEDEAVDEDDELQVAEWDQAAADTAYREQVGPRT